MANATFDSFQGELQKLVGAFAHNLAEHKKPSYVEAQLRDDFLNPFFAALGWDIANTQRLIQNKREVEIESRTQIQGRQKRADYLFRVDDRDRFVCEAKKPAEELHANTPSGPNATHGPENSVSFSSQTSKNSVPCILQTSRTKCFSQ